MDVWMDGWMPVNEVVVLVLVLVLVFSLFFFLLFIRNLFLSSVRGLCSVYFLILGPSLVSEGEVQVPSHLISSLLIACRTKKQSLYLLT